MCAIAAVSTEILFIHITSHLNGKKMFHSKRSKQVQEDLFVCRMAAQMPERSKESAPSLCHDFRLRKDGW